MHQASPDAGRQVSLQQVSEQPAISMHTADAVVRYNASRAREAVPSLEARHAMHTSPNSTTLQHCCVAAAPESKPALAYQSAKPQMADGSLTARTDRGERAKSDTRGGGQCH
jgi:hypothetical protein